jgi:hypothetical protein
MMEFLGPLLAQLAGKQAGQQMAQGGGGMGMPGGAPQPAGGGQQQGGGGMLSQQLAQANPLFGALKGGLDAGLKAPVTGAMPQQPAQVPSAAPQPAAAALEPPQQPQGLGMGGQQQSAPLFRGSAPAGNGGLSGAIPGLGSTGAMPTMASNMGRVFPGMGMAPQQQPMQQQQGGLQLLMQLLRGGMGAGL